MKAARARNESKPNRTKEFHSAKLFKNEIGTWVDAIAIAIAIIVIR